MITLKRLPKNKKIIKPETKEYRCSTPETVLIKTAESPNLNDPEKKVKIKSTMIKSEDREFFLNHKTFHNIGAGSPISSKKTERASSTLTIDSGISEKSTTSINGYSKSPSPPTTEEYYQMKGKVVPKKHHSGKKAMGLLKNNDSIDELSIRGVSIGDLTFNGRSTSPLGECASFYSTESN